MRGLITLTSVRILAAITRYHSFLSNFVSTSNCGLLSKLHALRFVEGSAPCCRYHADGVLGVRVTPLAAIEIKYHKCVLNAIELGFSRKVVGLGGYCDFGTWKDTFPGLFVKQK